MLEIIPMTTDTVKPADAGVLREVATDLEQWGPPANDNGARAARLRALAEVLEKIEKARDAEIHIYDDGSVSAVIMGGWRDDDDLAAALRALTKRA
jgi:hypothetical protein